MFARLSNRLCAGTLIALGAALAGLQAHAAVTPDAGAAKAEEPADPVFDLLELQVEGNSVLPIEVIERVVTPFVGLGKSMRDVESARQALEQAYQQAGFLTVFVDVPEQKVQDGVVRLAVTEGKVDTLRVTGSRYFAQGYIRAKVPELAEGRVPNFNQVQREVAQLNQTESRQVQQVLRPGVAPGTVDIDLQVKDRLPLSGNVEINNQHPAHTSALRLNASARYDNLWQLDHSLSLTVITAPQHPKESRVFVANYLVPMAEQATWLTSLVVSDSQVEPLASTSVIGKGHTWTFRYIRPIGARPGEYHSLAMGLDIKDLKQKVQDPANPISTPLFYAPFSVAYNGNISGEGGELTTLNAQWVAAWQRLGSRQINCAGNVMDQFDCNRQGADGGFSYLRVDARHTQPLGKWGSLALRLGGQYSNDLLVSAEQYVLGGANTVRGYLESETSGDQGWNGSVEWRSNNLIGKLTTAEPGTPPGSSTSWFSEAVVYGFADGARARTLMPVVGQQEHTYLGGLGFGLRVKGWQKMNGELEVAWPKKLTASTTSHSPRVHFKVGLPL